VFVVRPVQRKDLDHLYALAKKAKAGLTTLPKDKKLLLGRIKASLNGFAKRGGRPNGEVYLFVMENIKTKKIVGTSAIISRVGVRDPFYTYEIKEAIRKSSELKVKNVIQYLQLKIIRNGPAEVGTLFLEPSLREKNCGRLMALSRYLFIAQYAQRFADDIIAELRGVIDERDRSAFWDAVGVHFFKMEYKKADLMVMEDKSFIADLVPRHPIYIPILTREAQKVIGAVHKNTVPALKLLQKEGFDFIPEVDIFEAGPVLKAKIGRIRTVKQSKELKVADIVDKIGQGDDYLIANVDRYEDFCVAKGRVMIKKGCVILSKETARALKVDVGQRVRIVKARG